MSHFLDVIVFHSFDLLLKNFFVTLNTSIKVLFWNGIAYFKGKQRPFANNAQGDKKSIGITPTGKPTPHRLK